MDSYAQNGEDRIVKAFFSDVLEHLPPDMAMPFFVEVGAGDGITYSNTYALERAGWNGLLIEPDPRSAERCRANRRARLIEAACVAPEVDVREPLTLYLATMPELSTLATDRDTDIERIHRNVGKPHGLVPVRVWGQQLSTILAGYAVLTTSQHPPYGGVDFLSIDTEWRNAETVRGMDFNRWKPRLVIIEANDIVEQAAIEAVMVRAGYRLGIVHVNNYFYVRDAADAHRIVACRAAANGGG